MTDWDPLVWLPDEEPLRAFYRGTFDAVFIAVHPFFRIAGLDPLQCQHGSVVVHRSDLPEDVDLLDYFKQLDAERAIGHPIAPSEVDDRAKHEGSVVSWREIGRRCDLSDMRAISRALRTTILGLRPEFADEAGADRLSAFCAVERIFHPTESEFQPIHERRLVDLFARAGCERVVLGDEFGEHDIAKPLDFLRGAPAWAGRADWPKISGVRRLYAEDRSMIAIVPWDQFFTVIAMTADRVVQTAVDDLFEGFWCDESTTLFWLRDPPQPAVGPAE